MAMEQNIIYLATKTKQLKTRTHIAFDETNMTLPPSQVPAVSTILQQLGYKSNDNLDADETPTTSTLDTEAQLYVLTTSKCLSFSSTYQRCSWL